LEEENFAFTAAGQLFLGKLEGGTRDAEGCKVLL
jgi:hypothetical protein